ncbi:MAG TPA: hypothetical protein VN845_00650 [Solirubrobacteraceae bacterium]|nr:hypothetical protein [Solirubrobacteraceae bacterium]
MTLPAPRLLLAVTAWLKKEMVVPFRPVCPPGSRTWLVVLAAAVVALNSLASTTAAHAQTPPAQNLCVTAPLTSDLSAVRCKRDDSSFSALSSERSPRLGRALNHLPGFGRAHPSVISYGGDPTSVVSHINWTKWGVGEAVGVGRSDWVWPGTCTGCNPQVAVRVIAFHLGTCRGYLSYNALEWYFPQYGETFKPGDYTNTCTHTAVEREPPPPPVKCPDATLAGEGTATEMSVQGMSCTSASQLIAESPAGPFATEQRWQESGFSCGTEGAAIGSNVVECALGERSVVYTATY